MQQCALSMFKPKLLEYLTIEDEAQIQHQFEGETWALNKQVLWSGVLREEAQRWANEHGMQTLTTAMGPLLNPMDRSYARKNRSPKAWRRYMKGASAIFAWHITRGEYVTILTPPPPERFHPSGLTSFQAIEEPILKGAISNHAVLRIDIAHPNVKGGGDYTYQLWPADEIDTWKQVLGSATSKQRCWRAVTTNPSGLFLIQAVTSYNACLQSAIDSISQPTGCGVTQRTENCMQNVGIPTVRVSFSSRNTEMIC